MLFCCKACGKSCDAMCKGCDCMCRGCGKCCDGLCNDFCCPHDKPSPIFTCFSIMASLGMITAAVITLISGQDEWDYCDHPLMVWLLVFIGLCVLNMIFACYMYWRLTIKMKQNETMSGKCNGMFDIFMYDPGVYVYCWVVIMQFVWAILGFVWGSASRNIDRACRSGPNGIALCAVFIFLFLFFSCFLIVASFCTECCRHGEKALNGRQQRRPYNNQQYNAYGNQPQGGQLHGQLLSDPNQYREGGSYPPSPLPQEQKPSYSPPPPQYNAQPAYQQPQQQQQYQPVSSGGQQQYYQAPPSQMPPPSQCPPAQRVQAEHVPLHEQGARAAGRFVGRMLTGK